MAHEEEPLAPDTIDEQLEHLAAQLPFVPPEAPRSADLRVVEVLQAAYAAERQADAASVARVWERLARQQETAAHIQSATLTPRAVKPDEQRRRPPRLWLLPRHAGRFAPLERLIAAVLVVVLIGGLTLGLILVHRPGTGSSGGPGNQQTSTVTTTQTPTPSSTPASGGGFSVTSIHMLDATIGWAFSPHDLLRTTDGGRHWQQVTPQLANLQNGKSLAAAVLTASMAWVVLPVQKPGAGTSVVFQTTDGGATWQQVGMAPDEGVDEGLSEGLLFLDAQHGWIIGSPLGSEAGGTPVDILRTTNGGASWVQVQSAQLSGAPGTLPRGDGIELTFLTPTMGWAAGTNPAANFFWLYMTRDGGATWQQQTPPLPPGVTQTQLVTMPPIFFGGQEGVLPVAYTGGSGASRLDVYVTHDGGATWQSTTPLTLQGAPGQADFVDAQHGWATDGTTLFATRDGGQHWTLLPASSAFQQVWKLDFVSNTTGWALSSDPASGTSTLLKTTNGGQTWTVITPGISH